MPIKKPNIPTQSSEVPPTVRRALDELRVYFNSLQGVTMPQQLYMVVSDPPTKAEVQMIADRLDALLARL